MSIAFPYRSKFNQPFSKLILTARILLRNRFSWYFFSFFTKLSNGKKYNRLLTCNLNTICIFNTVCTFKQNQISKLQLYIWYKSTNKACKEWNAKKIRYIINDSNKNEKIEIWILRVNIYALEKWISIKCYMNTKM